MLETLMLHDVQGSGDIPAGPYACAVHVGVLEEYLVRRKNWINWGGDDLAVWLNSGCPKLDRPAYLLTIDDAYQSVLTQVLPVLTRNRVKAIVFVATRCAAGWDPVDVRLWRALNVGCHLAGTRWSALPLNNHTEIRRAYDLIRVEVKPLPPSSAETLLEPLFQQAASNLPRPYLSWDDIVSLKDSPWIEFGSHTHEHVHLPTNHFDEIRRQLVCSRRELQDRLGYTIRWLAYPYGAVSPMVLAQTWFAGYEGAFIARRSHPCRFIPVARFMMPRVELHDGMEF